MNLLVISHTPHIRVDGVIYGWGPTIKEINFLAENSFSLTHIAPILSNVSVPESYQPISKAIHFVGVRNRGGTRISDKLNVLADCFTYVSAIRREILKCDSFVHVRCPANIALAALFLLIFFPRRKKWIKYAGDWQPKNDFLTYRVQRFIIRNLLRNHVVTVNGFYPDERKFIHYFLNPSFTLKEIAEVQSSTKAKILNPHLVVELIFVGALEKNKGVDVALETLCLLKREYPCTLVVIGDGSEAAALKKMAKQLGISESVRFEGWRSREELKEYYAPAHFIILPSEGEGWPKVISEAMAFGVVPVVSNVSGVKYTLSKFNTGTVVTGQKPLNYYRAIQDYFVQRSRWVIESKNAMLASREFSFDVWWKNLDHLFAQNLRHIGKD